MLAPGHWTNQFQKDVTMKKKSWLVFSARQVTSSHPFDVIMCVQSWDSDGCGIKIEMFV